MKQIPLTKEAFALVDDEDYDHLIQYSWHLHSAGYAVCKVYKNSKAIPIYMHRLIRNIENKKIQIDHIDGNRLNNCKENLRLSNVQTNQRNRGKQKNNKSGFKGVYWHKETNKFRAQIVINKTPIHLGLFSTAQQASEAYETKAREVFGAFYKSK